MKNLTIPILTLFLILSFNSYSQGITISESQAKEAIKTKRELIKATNILQAQGLLIIGLEKELENVKSQLSSEKIKNGLLHKNYISANQRVENEKSKNSTFKNILIGIGLFATGFLAGSL